MRIRYSSKSDFEILKDHVYSRYLKLSITEKYIVNNLNYNYLIPNSDILYNEDIICIFLIRESKSTLSSLLNPKFSLMRGLVQKSEYNEKDRLYWLQNIIKSVCFVLKIMLKQLMIRRKVCISLMNRLFMKPRRL